MNKEKIIRKVIATGKRELKLNFEVDYGVRDFTTATATFNLRISAEIPKLLEEINEISSKQGVPFKVEFLDSGVVKFTCLDDNKEVIKTLVEKGW